MKNTENNSQASDGSKSFMFQKIKGRKRVKKRMKEYIIFP